MESEIVKRLQKNDQSAFAQLYKEYSHRIYLNALKLTKETNIAEDIVQEVFIILWNKRMSIDPAKPIINWIFVVSYHKSIDYLKKKLKTELLSEESFPCVQSTNNEEALIREHRLDLIERAAEQLSPQKKRVFEICKLQGRTYKKAAQEMQISKHTVKEYLSGAMKNIRTFIQASQTINGEY